MSKNVKVNGNEEELPRLLVAVTVAVNMDSGNSGVRLIPRSKRSQE
jgi:hypothetical protein